MLADQIAGKKIDSVQVVNALHAPHDWNFEICVNPALCRNVGLIPLQEHDCGRSEMVIGSAGLGGCTDHPNPAPGATDMQIALQSALADSGFETCTLHRAMCGLSETHSMPGYGVAIKQKPRTDENQLVNIGRRDVSAAGGVTSKSHSSSFAGGRWREGPASTKETILPVRDREKVKWKD